MGRSETLGYPLLCLALSRDLTLGQDNYLVNEEN
jgi:hypothetical protein